MKTYTLAVVTVFALGATSPARAQEHQHPAEKAGAPDMAAMHCGGEMAGMMNAMPAGKPGMPGMSGDMKMPEGKDKMEAGMAGMMEMMGPPTPAMYLHHQDKLDLTSNQVARLKSLQGEAQPLCVHHMEMAMTSHHAANQLLDATAPDFTAFKAKLNEAAGHMVEAQLAMAKASVAAREVLTVAQRQAMKSQMEEMHKH